MLRMAAATSRGRRTRRGCGSQLLSSRAFYLCWWLAEDFPWLPLPREFFGGRATGYSCSGTYNIISATPHGVVMTVPINCSVMVDVVALTIVHAVAIAVAVHDQRTDDGRCSQDDCGGGRVVSLRRGCGQRRSEERREGKCSESGFHISFDSSLSDAAELAARSGPCRRLRSHG